MIDRRAAHAGIDLDELAGFELIAPDLIAAVDEQGFSVRDRVFGHLAVADELHGKPQVAPVIHGHAGSCAAAEIMDFLDAGAVRLISQEHLIALVNERALICQNIAV